MTLIAASVVSVWQAVIARDAQHQAETDRDRAETALTKVEAAERRATTEAAVARAVNIFLQDDLLKQANSEPQDYSESMGNPDLTMMEALDRASTKVGDRFRDQPVVEAVIRTAIGEAYNSLHQLRPAAKHLERAVELRKAHLGPQHPETLHSLRQLAEAYTWIGRGPDAVVVLKQVLEDATARLGPDDPELLGHMDRLARAYRRMGDWKKAIRLFEQVIEKDAARRGSIVAGASNSAMTLALTYVDAGQPAEGAARMDKVRECRFKTTGGAYDTLFEHTRSCAYQRAGRLDEADHVMRVLADALRQRGARGVIDLARNLEMLSENLLLQHRYSEAAQTARESIALYEKKGKKGADEIDWRLPYVKNVLGGALLCQKKYAEAEPLLLQGYEGMKRAEALIIAEYRCRLPEAGERVIRYYEETKQPEKARAWREKMKPAPHPGP
jgi:tetratricopeptide (TPR) repeat protein